MHRRRRGSRGGAGQDSPGDVQGSLLLLSDLLVLGGGVELSRSHGFRWSELRTTVTFRHFFKKKLFYTFRYFAKMHVVGQDISGLKRPTHKHGKLSREKYNKNTPRTMLVILTGTR